MLLVDLNPKLSTSSSMYETQPTQLLFVLLDKLIDLGDFARQISQALGGNGHRPHTLQEVI